MDFYPPSTKPLPECHGAHTTVRKMQSGVDIPPSSMLASRVVNGGGLTAFDRESFEQLLEESLGADENDTPNLGTDVSVNYKLICIIFKAGIEPALKDTVDNPFNARGLDGKDNVQFSRCLDVLHLAITRSPAVLFIESTPEDQVSGDSNVALYVWLLPQLIPILRPKQNGDIVEKVISILSASIEANEKVAQGYGCDCTFNFIRQCISVLLDRMYSSDGLSIRDQPSFDDDEFMETMSNLKIDCSGLSSRLNFDNVEHLLYSICNTMKVLSEFSNTQRRILQYRKQAARLYQLLDDIIASEEDSNHLQAFVQTFEPEATANIDEESTPDLAIPVAWPDSDRPRKRARLSVQNGDNLDTKDFKQRISRKLTQQLTGHAVTDLEGLSANASSHFRGLSENEQCTALMSLGAAACQLSNGFEESCPACEAECGLPATSTSAESEILLETLLVLAPLLSRSSRARIVAMVTLRRLLLHSESLEHIKLNQSAAGEWCLQSLRSSSRDLRVAAAQTLQVYVIRRRNDSSLTRENRITALDCLQTLWNRNDASLQETAVLALTRMAQVVGDEELNIILLRLVEYLGSTNPYLSGLVYAEIQQLAQCLQMTVAAMFRPFWRTLSVVIVKNISTRSTIAQQVCDLLGMQLNGLMILIEEHSLPYLILNRNHDLIRRFAAAHGSNTTTYDICSQRKNRISILSFLLAQPFPDAEERIMRLLLDVSADFGIEDLAGWIAHDPIQIACELLKAMGDEAGGKASRAYQALQLLSQLIGNKPGHSAPSKRADNIGSFLETNALAIVTHFTVLLNDMETKEPKMEKRRCLAALGEVVKLGKGRVVISLPQICACLRSALEDPELCNTAFASWAVMISSLKENEFEPLIDQTLAIIVKTWETFDTPTQQRAYTLISNLLKSHETLVRNIFGTMPSLASIPLMSKFEAEIGSLKRQMDERNQLTAYIARLQNENLTVVEQALIELTPTLREKQDLLHRSILREQPDPYVADLMRALLDCCVKFNTHSNITRLCGQCLGSIGSLDSNKVETIRERKSLVVLSNFGKAEETVDFIMFFLEHVLVEAFRSASSTRAQGFLAWAMQEFLKLAATDDDGASKSRQTPGITHRRLAGLSESAINTLVPFLNSKYTVQEARQPLKAKYPLFKSGMPHRVWLQKFTLDFLHRGPGENVSLIFGICCRIINGQDTSIPSFLLPYAALTLVISGIDSDSQEIIEEILHILHRPMDISDRKLQEDLKLCSQTIFEVLDYMGRWLQHKRKQYSVALSRSERGADDPILKNALAQIRSVEHVLESIPPELLSQRAIDCKSYARALFHWEQFMRKSTDQDVDSQLSRLQEIYAQIDEPDGIEGISSRMTILTPEQQVIEHRKAGRWTAAQTWYEMQLTERPDDVDIQRNLMNCLKESGQYDVLLHHCEGLVQDNKTALKHIAPYAIEAAWTCGRWDKVAQYIKQGAGEDFISHLGGIFLALRDDDQPQANSLIDELYGLTAAELTPTATVSLHTSHDTLMRLHILDDVRSISNYDKESRTSALEYLGKRLDVLGSNVTDKQYLLGIRRAVMQIKRDIFDANDVARAWLASARLARKSRSSSQAFGAVLRASALGDRSAAIEQAKLMWQEGHHRKAIQALEGAIESKAFVAHNYVTDEQIATLTTEQQNYQNEVTAKAYVLLGKWLDQAGQTQSEIIIRTFRKSTENYRKWEKGWYYLGRHYNRILDSEKSMPPGKESQTYLTGEAAKVVIENYLRSLMNGSKYVFQTLPKVLTLWLELVAGADQPLDPRRGNEKFHNHNAAQRKKVIDDTNSYIKKYIERIQPVVLYTILPQVVARICHTDPVVYGILVDIVVKVVRAFPQQALWTLLAVVKSQSKDRASRGLSIVSKVVEAQKKSSKDMSASDLRSMITAGQKFSDEVLRISEFPIEGKVSRVSLARDLGFNHKIAPSKLVVPSETCLIPSIPVSYEPAQLKSFRPFAKEPITVSAFLDEALVLASLQKPRKLTIRGSDGNLYGVLAKPKDDMRKDQRLMEFNTMINRFLKRDVDASKRRLYIRTYAVIPLNEECGLIEWVNNLKTFRDIILKLYKDKSITPNYTEIRNLLDQSCSGPPEKIKIFTNMIAKTFPPVFHEWFVESFPDPSAWFNARLRYTRSCAVMSIVGHVLGLGDRHGENISFEEDNGGTLHVDFNCLFDKGLTFEKPECVPFRLTHNMVDAFGAYGYEGPFRRCSEITLTLLRANEDALMTILETFLHDPTTDFIEKGRRKKQVAGVPNTPIEVLEGVRGKVRGMLQGESVPLSVGGYVEEMIKRATDHANLCRMYIGWCAFF